MKTSAEQIDKLESLIICSTLLFLMHFCNPGWMQGVEIIRGCRGLNLVGCDLVEVSPPYDTTGASHV